MEEAMSKGAVLIFAQAEEGQPLRASLELLGVGRGLAEALGVPLAAALLGHEVGSCAEELIAHGADQVYVAAHPDLEEYRSDPQLAVLERLCRETSPAVFLFSHDEAGRDLAPRLAFRLGTGLAPDCIELAIDPQSKRLSCLRPVYGGNLQATVAMDGNPQIATLRPKSQEPAARQEGRTGQVIPLPVELEPGSLRVKILGRVKEEQTGVRLEDAEVIVTAGRGVESQEGVQMLEELARLLGGAVGATRGSVDAGLMPAERQIGLTGKMVGPKLYIAVALSGSMQHMAGCAGARTIVAINTDPQAPIFQRAHYGAVGDYRKVVPRLTEKVRELLS
jgi:electron transfer flavoprotein alpha subunit